ncbi:MAG: hypothetical protein QXX94_06270 [Candidatus Bathyarchaeia archaeon]
MFVDRAEARRRLMEVVERFRERGATSPERALTVQELGLPPYFERAMRGWLGRLGIFVKVDGRYYLDEDRLRRLQERFSRIGYRRGAHYIGIILMLPIGLIISLAIFYLLLFSGARLFPGEFLLILTVVIVAVSIIRILYWRSRRRYWSMRKND